MQGAGRRGLQSVARSWQRGAVANAVMMGACPAHGGPNRSTSKRAAMTFATPVRSAPLRLTRAARAPAALQQWLASACVAAAGLGAASAASATEAPRDNQVSFAATASVEVAKDVLSVTLQATRDGNEAAVVQGALKQALDAALNEARRAAQPGALEVRTGSFNLSPRYGRDGKPNGWTGNADLTIEGRDVGRVAATAGKISGLNIVSTGYSVSRELREQHESALIAQAIQKYQARAGEIARQFGFTGYTLRELNVQTSDGEMPRPPVMMRTMAMASADAAPLPTEAGKGLLTATVQGTVQLTR